MILNEQQENIEEHYLATRDNLMENASAGTGKTTLLEHLFNNTSSSKKILYIVFAKKNQEEAQEKMPENVKCITMHALGLSIITANNGFPKINNNKQIEILQKHYSGLIKQDRKMGWRKVFQMDRLIQILRVNLLHLNYNAAVEVLSQHTLDYEDSDIETSLTIIRKLRKQSSLADFTNMLEWAALENVVFPNYDIVAMDECQDVTNLGIEILIKLQAKRYIFVGDVKQQIYHFAGSNPLGIRHLIEEFDCKEFDLQYTWRCKKQITDYANEIFPNSTFSCVDGEGKITSADNIESIKEGDMVLCRTNTPLIDVYYQLLEKHIPATILGKEIERGLKRFLKQYVEEDMSTEELLDRLRIEKFNMAERKASMKEMDEFEEKAEAVSILSRNTSFPSEITLKIEELFMNKGTRAVKLMSIHRSKGLENERVFHIRKYDGKTLLPHRTAETNEEKYVERCLDYVARTRAKTEFIELSI